MAKRNSNVVLRVVEAIVLGGIVLAFLLPAFSTTETPAPVEQSS